VVCNYDTDRASVVHCSTTLLEPDVNGSNATADNVVLVCMSAAMLLLVSCGSQYSISCMMRFATVLMIQFQATSICIVYTAIILSSQC
jgi:hypothetical protein